MHAFFLHEVHTTCCCCCWRVFLLDASNVDGAADPVAMFVTWHSKQLWVCKISTSVPQHKWLACLPLLFGNWFREWMCVIVKRTSLIILDHCQHMLIFVVLHSSCKYGFRV